MAKTAWVAGASGLVGGCLVTQLCDDHRYDHVIALVRRPGDENWSQHPKCEQWCVDYDTLEHEEPPRNPDHVFCALGSTARKTPDKKEYFKVDVTYPLKFAQLAKTKGASGYALVSSHGAKAKSLSTYLSMKGQIEQELIALDFPHLVIARPGILKGQRSEFRLKERISETVLSLMPGNFKAIHALDLAAAMISAANNNKSGTEILESAKMQGAYQAPA